MQPGRELVYDWDAHRPRRVAAPRRVTIQEETLRDGLQNPSVTDPTPDEKAQLLHLMDGLGIEHVSLGLPAAGPRQREAVERLCREIDSARLAIRPNCGGRTVLEDVRPIVEISQRVGIAIEACVFVGSSPIRRFAEDWDLDRALENTRQTVAFLVNEGLETTFITEDTTRSTPENLASLFDAAIQAGATRICLCDTVGAATVDGVTNLVDWTRRWLDAAGSGAGIDWHGHRDRGLEMANALAAVNAGADRIHATALGLGERAGNTATEQLMVNLKLLGLRDGDLVALPDYVEAVARVTRTRVPHNAPIVGRDAFRTATGVHAAAVAKAHRKGDAWLADRVYSSVPAGWLGRDQEIEIGHLSGAANVHYYLERRGLRHDRATVQAVLRRAKRASRVLSEDDVRAVLQAGEAPS